jgi:phage terminase large subunit-like protein
VISAGLTRAQANAAYDDAINDDQTEAQRELARGDLFFLLTRVCKRRDIDRDWLYDRCREVEASPDGHLDLWFREGYKSTIITFGKSIQDVLGNPEQTTGIFSHTRPIAKSFLEQIKRELETNTDLKSLFPDVLYQHPQKESPKWSLDGGLIVRRKTNPKEATWEAWGLVDGQPIGKHFSLLNYDDVVTRESVSNPDQIKKTTEALELSYSLGAQGGKRRFIGTRYHQNDSYKVIIERGTAKPRIHTATIDGKYPGTPVLLTQESLDEKRRDMGPYTFSCQMLQDPVADKAMGFKPEWLRFYQKLGDTSKWNKYIIVDPASKKKKTSDYTVMSVIGLAPDNNYYRLDAIRDRLNLTQRADKLFELHRKWNPKAIGYESYGMQSDIEHMRYKMEVDNYRFSITELGGTMAKEDRIKMLVPVYEQGRFYSPERLMFIDYEQKAVDYVKAFIEDEYSAFPVAVHDDMMDCEARILDPRLGAEFPKLQAPQDEFAGMGSGGGYGWMA